MDFTEVVNHLSINELLLHHVLTVAMLHAGLETVRKKMNRR